MVRFATCLVAVMIAAMGVAGANGVMVASHRAERPKAAAPYESATFYGRIHNKHSDSAIRKS